ncbi:MAG: glycogen debranching enzyme N-terminal domain-containing protein, partial [Bradymonadaceae bacterium]
MPDRTDDNPTSCREWLEPDGLGGFASGTADGIRTRRYHALLLTATTPPTGRMVLVNGHDARVTTDAGDYPLTAQRYTPDVVHPDGRSRIASFTTDPWPTWRFALEDGTVVVHELFAVRGRPATVLRWRLADGDGPATLTARPFLSGRDFHALHHENAAFQFEAEHRDDYCVWRPYEGVPAISVQSNGTYEHAPHWYRDFLYEKERARGLDHVEDLASPGTFSWDLTDGDAVWILQTDGPDETDADALARATAFAEREHDRRSSLESS